MQLEPREYFTIVRELDDPLDTSTYYVRALARNARTDALIGTVDLEDKGSQRFSKPWQVPADKSGLGFYILITTFVYTDASYSTLSEDYGKEAVEHLVQVRSKMYGGGGGSDVDYEKVREIVKAEVNAIELPEQDVVDLTNVLDGQKRLGNALKLVAQALTKSHGDIGKVLNGIRQSVKDTNRNIRNIKIPEPEKVDLEPVKTAFSELQVVVGNMLARKLNEDQILKNLKTLIDEFSQSQVLVLPSKFQAANRDDVEKVVSQASEKIKKSISEKIDKKDLSLRKDLEPMEKKVFEL